MLHAFALHRFIEPCQLTWFYPSLLPRPLSWLWVSDCDTCRKQQLKLEINRVVQHVPWTLILITFSFATFALLVDSCIDYLVFFYVIIIADALIDCAVTGIIKACQHQVAKLPKRQQFVAVFGNFVAWCGQAFTVHYSLLPFCRWSKIIATHFFSLCFFLHFGDSV